jgi:outer membrane lipoprotein-sorting protein
MLLCLLIGTIAGLPGSAGVSAGRPPPPACRQDGGAPSQKPGDVQALLSRMQAKAAQLQDYTISGETDAQGKQTKWKLYFKQPNLVRVDLPRGQATVEPNGEIRGRLGRGLFGKVSRKLKRDDPRLKDPSGVPFWETDYAGILSQIQSAIKAGATATLTVTPDAYDLDIRSGQTDWRYVIDPKTLFFREGIRSESGKQVVVTQYRVFSPNVGLETKVFEF